MEPEQEHEESELPPYPIEEGEYYDYDPALDYEKIEEPNVAEAHEEVTKHDEEPTEELSVMFVGDRIPNSST